MIINSKAMVKRIKSALSLILGLAVVLLFQHCSDLDNSNVVSLTDVERDVLTNLPFAFNLKIDQMAYMSCSGEDARQDSRSFTIKAGGYFPGSGVGLRTNYTAAISGFNADTKVRSIAISERNDQAGAIMSIRPRSDLQNYVDPSRATGEIPLAQLMFREPQGLVLSNERVAKQLMALGPNSYLNYAAGLPGLFNKSFDGTLRIANNLGTEDTIRNILRNSHYVAFNFAEPLGDQPPDRPYSFVRSPYDTLTGDSRASTSVYGLGYVLNFQQLDPFMTTTPSRVMTVSSVINLENSSSEPENWDCSERFVVVRPEDAARITFNSGQPGGAQQVCDTRPDAVPNSFEEQRRWERIRNILPVEDWYVNLPCPAAGPQPAGCITGVAKPGCIVSKSNDFCYDENELNPDNNEFVRVAYYRNENLDRTTAPIFTYDGRCGPGTFFMCPHVLTICRKL